MATASITITDKEDGQLSVDVDFGDKYDETSQAHGLIGVLLNSVLSNAKTFDKVEDTAPELNAEPSLVITPE